MNKSAAIDSVLSILFIEIFTNQRSIINASKYLNLIREIYKQEYIERFIEFNENVEDSNSKDHLIFENFFLNELDGLVLIGGMENAMKFKKDLLEIMIELSKSLRKGGN